MSSASQVLASSLNRVRPDGIKTAADLIKALRQSPVQLTVSQLPKPPLQPKSALDCWLEERREQRVPAPAAEAGTRGKQSAAGVLSEDFIWRTMSREEKLVYKERAIADLLRYKADYEEYKKIAQVTLRRSRSGDPGAAQEEAAATAGAGTPFAV